jgi:cephalosporin-C deacetylase-like acetyl esterase
MTLLVANFDHRVTERRMLTDQQRGWLLNIAHLRNPYLELCRSTPPRPFAFPEEDEIIQAMKLSRRELLAGGAASIVAGLPAHAAAARPAQSRQPVSLGPSRSVHPPNFPIRDYLIREAQRITDSALADLKTPAEFKKRIPERRRLYMEMMGLTDLPAAKDRPSVAFRRTGVLERSRYRIEKLHYESLPNLHVTANLYIPNDASPERRRPGLLYLCGHAPKQKVHYQAHPKRLAELGFPTLIVDTVQLGEAAGYHHGCYREGWFHWYSRGYSSAAIELLNGIRGLDLLAARPEVDADRLGVTGLSGGGAVTWWIAAADERVKACSPVCGTATLESHVQDRVIDGHCDCMWWVNTARWDLADVGALIAPRPLLIASANQDGIFPIHAIRKVHAQLQRLYSMLNKSENLRLVETPGGHSYHERSRTAIFSWFLKHLMGQDVAPGEVGDIELDEGRQESEETLKVYVNGMPAGNRVATIHDELIKVAVQPAVSSTADLERERRRIVNRLRAETFAHFPRRPPALTLEEEYALDGGVGTRFAFTSEEGWRLHGVRRQPRETTGTSPAVVVLRSPGEDRLESETFAGQIDAAWVKIIVEPRGTGDTSWGDDLNWHVRRAAAWTGRTIASMRVWDALRALEATRLLPGVVPSQVAIAARGEMAVVALYAALLDGRLTTVLLESPPATQNAASTPNGRGPAVELLNCLRYTDVPHVAGLLYPAEIVVSGEWPSAFEWAEDLYRRLGAPGRFSRVQKMSGWRPMSS